MTLVDDACATHSAHRHREALDGFRGYCRVRTTAELLEELESMGGGRGAGAATASWDVGRNESPDPIE